MMCSKKFKDCKSKAIMQLYEQMKNDKNSPLSKFNQTEVQNNLQQKLVNNSYYPTFNQLVKKTFPLFNRIVV